MTQVMIKNYRVRPVNTDTERRFMYAWHYSKKVVSNSVVRLGCYHHDRLLGVATFGRIINCVPLFHGCSNRGGLELNRLAMDDAAPKNSESWFLMRCIRLLRKKYPWLRFIHTWADGARCQGGTIYKACGFLYLRKKKVEGFYRLPDGQVIHQIAFNKVYLRRFYTRLKQIPGRLEKVQAVFGPGTTMITGGHQFNYVYLIDQQLRSQLRFPPLAYEPPTRGSYNGSTAGIQPAGDGSTPIPALQGM